MNESPENYRCLIFCCLYISFVPDNSRTPFPYFSLYVKKTEALCTLLLWKPEKERNSLCISKAVSLYTVDFDN